jgi:multicomponent Na+:H+ antiporter subunit D
MITPKSLWLGIAAASALTGAILMLSQRDLKRLLVLSTIEDIGFLMLGVASADALGMKGALLGAVAHSLAKALLFVCISTPESEGALSAESTGLTARYPVSGFGFVFGMLAVLGVPPTMGYLGRWRLYATAAQISPWMLAAFIVSSALALIAYVLALTRFWWGPAPDDAANGKEPVILKAMIVLLVVLLLAGGLWPHVLQAASWGMQ